MRALALNETLKRLLRANWELYLIASTKYIKLGEANVTGEQVRKMKHEQVAVLEEVKMLTEATSQVKKYRQGLQNKYDDKLRLRTYVVVALGFERIVWQEVTNY